MDQPGGEHRPVKSAERTLVVLELLATGPRTLAGLVKELGLPKSSLHDILRTLEDHGWVERAGGDGRFRLGLRALQVGSAYLGGDDTISRVAPVLDWLSASTGETVQFARLDGADVVYLAKRNSTHPVRLISTVGSRLPAHATALGKALLAARSDVDVLQRLCFPLPALTGRTITDWDTLAAQLWEIRERGYATDDEEAAAGLRCFAAAPRTPAPPTDAISISLPAFRLTDDVERHIVDLLAEARSRLEELIGAFSY